MAYHTTYSTLMALNSDGLLNTYLLTHKQPTKDHNTMKTLNTIPPKEAQVQPIFDRFTNTGYHADVEELRNKIIREAISGEYTTRSFWEQMTEDVFFPSLKFQVMDPTHYYGKK